MSFMKLAAKYNDVQELDRAIVHELIEKIVVHQAQRIDGQWVQQIDIYYRFIGKTLVSLRGQAGDKPV